MSNVFEPSAEDRLAMKRGIRDLVELRKQFARRVEPEELINEIIHDQDRAAWCIVAAVTALQAASTALQQLTGRNEADLWSMMLSELSRL